MNGDRIEMSQRERDRLKVMALMLEGKRTQREAARLLGLTDRQIRRLQHRLQARPPVGNREAITLGMPLTEDYNRRVLCACGRRSLRRDPFKVK